MLGYKLNPQVTILFVHSTHLSHTMVPIRTEMLSYLGNHYNNNNNNKKIHKQNSTVAVARKGDFTKESLNICFNGMNQHRI
jgi:hypothetical protein